MKLKKTKKTGKQHNNDLPQFPNVVLCLPFPREKRVGGGRGGGGAKSLIIVQGPVKSSKSYSF